MLLYFHFFQVKGHLDIQSTQRSPSLRLGPHVVILLDGKWTTVLVPTLNKVKNNDL